MDAPIEVKYYLEDPTSPESIAECKRVADILHRTSALVIRDPRVTFEDNSTFLDVIEKYFEQPYEVKMVDVRPELSYQVGPTPEGTENPRCVADVECHKLIEAQAPENKAHIPTGPDAKWRFFHRIGPRPEVTKFGELNAAPVIPAAFPDWNTILNAWGEKLSQAAFTIAEMAAIGFGAPKDTFTQLLVNGPHLLAPTASDLGKHDKLDTILAGFHRDLNFLTLHGKSRFPGLDVWLRDGTKMPVVVPDGCLLAQAGMEFEHMTGGVIKAGWHEVIVNAKTVTAIEKAKAEGRCLWRISSTLFCHVASDAEMVPMIGTEEEKAAALKQYPPTLAGDHVNAELEAINLAKKN